MNVYFWPDIIYANRIMCARCHDGAEPGPFFSKFIVVS